MKNLPTPQAPPFPGDLQMELSLRTGQHLLLSVPSGPSIALVLRRCSMCLLKHITGNEAIDSSSFLAGGGPFLPRWRERPPGRRCWRRHETLCSSALLISQMSGGWEKWISSSSSQIIRVLLWFFFKRIIKREGPSSYSHVGKASHISREEKKCSGNWPGFGPQPVSLQGLEMLPHGEEGDCSPKGQASDTCWL